METAEDLEAEALELAEQELRDGGRDSMLGFTLVTKPDYDVNWHHRKLCEYLDRFVAGELKRLMVFMPPRHGKSELVSRRLPAYILGKDPDASIIGTSYGADLASRMNRDVQRIIDSPHYPGLYPDTTLNGSNVRSVASGSWLRNSDIFEVVGHRGVYRSAGVGGAITGMGMHYGIIDDPIKNQQEADSVTIRNSIWDWYVSTFYTRLEKDGAILLTMTRWHEDDLAGRLLAQAAADPEADQWVVLNLEASRELENNPDDPRAMGEALWPRKYDEKRLKAIRATVGPQIWNALFQQRPSAPEGISLKRKWWKYYRELPAKIDELILVFDLTFDDTKDSDYFVGECWARAGAEKFLVDEVRGQMDFPTQVQAMRLFAAKHPRAIEKIVEKKANGAAAIATLKKEIPGLIPYNPETSKPLRVKAVSPEIEAGNVYLPDPIACKAPWVNDFVEECASFPKNTNDDRVDCMAMALLRFQSTGSDDFTKELVQKIRGRHGTFGAPSTRSGDKW